MESLFQKDKKPLEIGENNSNQGENSYYCEICNKGFPRKNHIKRHVLTVHEEKKLFQCPICGLGLSAKNSLDRHVARIHKGEKGLKCDFCEFTCFSKGKVVYGCRILIRRFF